MYIAHTITTGRYSFSETIPRITKTLTSRNRTAPKKDTQPSTEGVARGDLAFSGCNPTPNIYSSPPRQLVQHIVVPANSHTKVSARVTIFIIIGDLQTFCQDINGKVGGGLFCIPIAYGFDLPGSPEGQRTLRPLLVLDKLRDMVDVANQCRKGQLKSVHSTGIRFELPR